MSLLHDYLGENGIKCNLFTPRDIIVNFSKNASAVVQISNNGKISIHSTHTKLIQHSTHTKLIQHGKSRPPICGTTTSIVLAEFDIYDPGSFPEVSAQLKLMASIIND